MKEKNRRRIQKKEERKLKNVCSEKIKKKHG